MRRDLCDGIGIARLLNATLVLPKFEVAAYWNESSGFTDVFDVDYFIQQLKGFIKVVKELPAEIASKEPVRVDCSKRKGQFDYIESVLPSLLKHHYISITPAMSQRRDRFPVYAKAALCQGCYSALRLTNPLETKSSELLEAIPKPFLSLHLRFEPDMVAYSQCEYQGLSPASMAAIEAARGGGDRKPFTGDTASVWRNRGKCPLTPNETALILQSLSIPTNTNIYLAAGDGVMELEGLTSVYTNVITKSSVLSGEELKDMHGNTKAALDYYVSINSDAYVATYFGNMDKMVAAMRAYKAKGAHNASIQYSLRTAYLGFLRCTHPVIMESRDKLLKILRAMNAGDAADQVMRQVDKMLRNSARDARANKDEQQPSSHMLMSGGDMARKRSTPMDQEHSDSSSKRSRYACSNGSDDHSVNGVSAKMPPLDNGLSPVEQMIAMIGALLAEGERGAESLEILISQIHPDLLADIVVTNMKHLPKSPPPLTRLSSQLVPRPSAAPLSPTPTSNTLLQSDPKRDSRRDPRRHDPRRVVGTPSDHIVEDAAQSGLPESDFDASLLFRQPQPTPPVEDKSEILIPKIETKFHTPENQSSFKEQVPNEQVGPDVKLNIVSDVAISSVDSHEQKSTDIITMTDEGHLPSSSFMDDDQLSPPGRVETPVMEETSVDLPAVPSYVELTEEQQRDARKMAIKRIIDSYKQLRGAEFMQTRMALLSRLVAQVDADDDVILMMQKHIVSDYQHQKGHELVMHVLYHLHAVRVSDSAQDSSGAVVYDKFLLGVAKCLLDALPASDKSLSRLFSEAPFLPESAFELLDEICCSDNNCGKDIRDGDRVTQGLGSLWSLILGRPHERQAFLDIALKCAVHPKDDIRAKAIRLVANKLYVISFISEKIEDFATNKLLSAVNRPVSGAGAELSVCGANEQRPEGQFQMGNQETSVSGSQISEPGTSESESMSPAQAQQHLSLFFALCTKKPSLLQLVFDKYDHAPKAVKQAVHRHVPILIRALGPSYSDLLSIISDPPQGSENLLTQVLHVLCEGTTPSADLIETVKRLYKTKLKDAAILIPILSSFTKNEVLPVFPRLVQLPLDKFQTALAHILQGSAHMGPALTPAEVLVAIHDISPEKDGVPLKKIMDACSACFEQRTVFTQQVLAKALNQMVDQTPLPLLFMRTVIQAMDAFPKLVDFVMELLSKLVSKQVWRMPKLWVGFLKCISQTQPHSFRVLLQLPSPQLEGALNKYGSLRGPLAAYASQPNIKSSLPRSTLQALGLGLETESLASSFNNPADKSAKGPNVTIIHT